MAGGKIQLDAAGLRRLRSTGERILADAAPCCCAQCLCVDLPSSLTLDGTLSGVSGPCDGAFTATLNQDPENPCIYYGEFSRCASTWPFYLRRRVTPTCGWDLEPFPFAGSNLSQVTRDDPTGAYPDVTNTLGYDFTGLVIS